MKLRCDFVTNSSSSSFLIAFKMYDEKEANADLLNRVIRFILESSDHYETKEAMICQDADDYEGMMMDYYGAENLSELEDYVSNYKEYEEYLKNGYSIAIKEIGYSDGIASVLMLLESDHLKILEGEYSN